MWVKRLVNFGALWGKPCTTHMLHRHSCLALSWPEIYLDLRPSRSRAPRRPVYISFAFVNSKKYFIINVCRTARPAWWLLFRSDSRKDIDHFRIKRFFCLEVWKLGVEKDFLYSFQIPAGMFWICMTYYEGCAKFN